MQYLKKLKMIRKIKKQQEQSNLTIPVVEKIMINLLLYFL
ncbi:hypothetical protein CUZ98_2014 [Enterococcus faecium]|nr:hypothetical protein [Enterococcus faecium]MBK4791609.1 hypothetical protein [Enterococcus faecium]MBK4846108.1 hypothetical protein [Enterococcus faecium]